MDNQIVQVEVERLVLELAEQDLVELAETCLVYTFVGGMHGNDFAIYINLAYDCYYLKSVKALR